MKYIAILGSTGSIGVNALDVIGRFPDRFRVVALAAGRNVERLAEQVTQFRPDIVSVADGNDIAALRSRLAPELAKKLSFVAGEQGVIDVVNHSRVNFVLTAMVGAIGLAPTVAAIQRGIEVAIANKEPLVAAGKLCTDTAHRTGARLLPVDSEHNAIFQCLRGSTRESIAQLILTCSGGPFRDVLDLSSVTRDQALKHPTWSMGPKITIDSATLMNKGLEVIEARWLFNMEPQRIKVVIHPESVVHSMVEFVDGSIIAQLGAPDMRIPIGYALGYPNRLPLEGSRLSLETLSRLSFGEPDIERFPCLKLAYDAIEAGGTAPAVLNAANEVAVAAFLREEISFCRIAEVIRRVLDGHKVGAADSLEQILAADAWARDHAQPVLRQLAAAA